MQDLDSNLAASENEWHRVYLSMRSAGFRLKPQMAFEVLSIIIHVIIAVASLFASMAIPGNSIDPQ